jgi:hypothetical protein
MASDFDHAVAPQNLAQHKGRYVGLSLTSRIGSIKQWMNQGVPF